MSVVFYRIYLFYGRIQFDSSLFHHLLISDRFDADTHGFIDEIECDYFSSAFFVYNFLFFFLHDSNKLHVPFNQFFEMQTKQQQQNPILCAESPHVEAMESISVNNTILDANALINGYLFCKCTYGCAHDSRRPRQQKTNNGNK